MKGARCAHLLLRNDDKQPGRTGDTSGSPSPPPARSNWKQQPCHLKAEGELNWVKAPVWWRKAKMQLWEEGWHDTLRAVGAWRTAAAQCGEYSKRAACVRARSACTLKPFQEMVISTAPIAPDTVRVRDSVLTSLLDCYEDIAFLASLSLLLPPPPNPSTPSPSLSCFWLLEVCSTAGTEMPNMWLSDHKALLLF